MIANIASDDGLILPHSANPIGSNFRERQWSGEWFCVQDGLETIIRGPARCQHSFGLSGRDRLNGQCVRHLCTSFSGYSPVSPIFPCLTFDDRESGPYRAMSSGPFAISCADAECHPKSERVYNSTRFRETEQKSKFLESHRILHSTFRA